MAISNCLSSYYYTRSAQSSRVGAGISYYDDIPKEIKMHPNSVFTSEYSLYYYYAQIETSNSEVPPKDIMYFEMHSRHLIPEYREFLFNNIQQLYYISDLSRLTHKEPHIIINSLFSKLLEINMYKKKIGQDYNLPSKLSKKYQELLTWYETWDISATF